LTTGIRINCFFPALPPCNCIPQSNPPHSDVHSASVPSRICLLCCVFLVVVTGLQTRAGTRVWVRRVWVRVCCKVPVQNPYPCSGYGGFFLFLLTRRQCYISSFRHSDECHKPFIYLSTVVYCLWVLIYLFYLGGSNAPKKGELVEAAYYILIDVYYCLVPVNKHERETRRDTMCSCLFTGTKQQ
jgi:hypothetical protein